jgi:hypothetical protein
MHTDDWLGVAAIALIILFLIGLYIGSGLLQLRREERENR